MSDYRLQIADCRLQIPPPTHQRQDATGEDVTRTHLLFAPLRLCVFALKSDGRAIRNSAGSATILACLLLCLVAAMPRIAFAADRDRLVYYAEAADGTVLASKGADTPFNPASVVKVGTSMWALERFGAGRRYATGFGITGGPDSTFGRADGALVVEGTGDPDFHVENAILVARELNRLGIDTVARGMLVRGTFWIGWENGVDRRISDPDLRAETMGERLRRAFDPDRWDKHIAASWRGLCDRRGLDPDSPPRVRVMGTIRVGVEESPRPLVVHHSNPLSVLLKRFNTYSNNDIIRVADGLGGPAGLEKYLRDRLGLAPDQVEITTGSGEGRNRMTARIAVRLMKRFMSVAEQRGLAVEDLLPVPGCDPGPTRRMFPRLVSGRWERTVVLKTGTLTTTDGGVVVLAGMFRNTRHGIVGFSVAARSTGRELTRWRRLQQEWLLDLMGSNGGAEAISCGDELPFSDTFAVIESIDRS
jgi:D-alanyl-D-alanine carboxypeptidase/D-alanyl-D-alanine-endopeptidase (penicillin-binding protein 4)